jgi:MFS family permease
MGWLADRLGGMRTMLLLAFASMGMVFVLSGASPFWPVWLVVLVGFALGVTSISWNGVFLAMVAQLAPRGRIGEATAGATFFIFLANTLAPLVFAIGVPRAGSYGACFAVVAAVQALALPPLLRLRRNR